MTSRNTRNGEIEYRRKLFEEKFSKGAPDDCWLWTAATLPTGKGYGIFAMGELCRAAKPAYVAAWLFYSDPNFDLDAKTLFTHLCGNTLCVNPRHLAIYGPDGLVNDKSVLEFIASRNPTVRAAILAALKKM